MRLRHTGLGVPLCDPSAPVLPPPVSLHPQPEEGTHETLRTGRAPSARRCVPRAARCGGPAAHGAAARRQCAGPRALDRARRCRTDRETRGHRQLRRNRHDQERRLERDARPGRRCGAVQEPGARRGRRHAGASQRHRRPVRRSVSLLEQAVAILWKARWSLLAAAARERPHDSRRCSAGHGDHRQRNRDRDPRLGDRWTVQPRPRLSHAHRPEREGHF